MAVLIKSPAISTVLPLLRSIIHLGKRVLICFNKESMLLIRPPSHKKVKRRKPPALQPQAQNKEGRVSLKGDIIYRGQLQVGGKYLGLKDL